VIVCTTSVWAWSPCLVPFQLTGTTFGRAPGIQSGAIRARASSAM
jgi:hypothetical protein